MADGKVVIDVILDDGTVAKGVANLDKELDGLRGSGERAALGIGKIVSALGLVALGAKAIGLIKDSMQQAFGRIDTLSRFDRVMNQITQSSEETQRALDATSKYVDGTAYTLDGAAASVMNFVQRGMDVDKATKTMEAWGDAVAFWGDGSQEQYATVSDALGKMLTKGTVGMDQLNRLFDAGIDAVGIYAAAVGEDASAVQDALSAGEISAEEFIDVVTDAFLSGYEGMESIAGAAKEAGSDWASVWANMRTRVAIGVAGIIESIDEMLANNGLPEMRDMIDAFSNVFRDSLLWVANDLVPKIGDAIQFLRDRFEDWKRIVDGLKETFEPFIEATKSAFQDFYDSLEPIWESLKKLFISLSPYIASVAAIVGGLLVAAFGLAISIFNATVSAIGPIIDAVINLADMFVNAISAIISLLSGDFKGALDYWEKATESSIEFIKKLWEGVVNFFVTFVETIVGFFKGLYNTLVGNSIIPDMVNAIIKWFTDMVDWVIDIVSGFIKSIIDFFVNMYQSMTETLNNALSKVQEVWNAIKSFFAEVLSAIWETVKEKFTNLVNSVREKMDEAKQRVEEGWKKAEQYLKGIDLLQIGKDIINGLIRGIRDSVTGVVNAVTSIGESIMGTLTGFFQTRSPSKVTTKTGEDVGQGVADGIANKAKEVSKETRQLANAVTEETEKMNKEVAKIEKRAKEDIHLIHVRANKAKRKLTQQESVRIRRIEEDTAKKIEKIHEQHAKEIQKINKASFDHSKNWIEKKKELNELSLADELDAWERVQVRFKAGSKEREEAEMNVYRVKKEIHDKLMALNDEYADKMKQVADEYEKAVADRASSIYSFVDLFDNVDLAMEQSGQQLFDNLARQVSALRQWEQQLEILVKRGIDKGLLAELQEMGPKALPELIALNELTDEQLTQYSEMYREKSRQAREIAEKELVGMKEDAEERLEELRDEWESKAESIRKGTVGEFNVMKSDLNDIGKQSIQGMINGLESMRGALMQKAQSIANQVKATMASALQIHSPSRWMRDMIGRNMMLGWMQGIDAEKMATIRKANEAAEWMKPDVPVVNRLRGVTAPIGNVTPISGAYSGGSSVTNNSSRAYNPTFNNYFTKDESTPSEVARKNKQQSQRQAMEWGLV